MIRLLLQLVQICLFICVFGFDQGCTRSPATEVLKPAVKTRKIERKDLQGTLRKGASVAYLEKAAIASPFPGTIEDIVVQPGDSVTRNEVVATLETLELELSLERARAKQASARARWLLARALIKESRKQTEKELKSLETARSRIIEARSKLLQAQKALNDRKRIYELGGLSRLEMKESYHRYISSLTGYYETLQNLKNRKIGFRGIDLKQANQPVPDDSRKQQEALIDLNTDAERKEAEAAFQKLQAARSNQQRASRMLKEATIRSPINGVVATRSKEPGEEIQARKPFLSVVRIDRLLVQGSISELERPEVHVGQRAFVTVDVYPDVEFEGKIHRISPLVDPESRSFQISVLVRNDSEHPLSPGMYAEIEIRTALKRNSLALPCALLASESRDVSGTTQEEFTFLRGHVYQQTVTVGQRFGDLCSVESGLDEGDLVVESNTALLRDGMPVEHTSSID
ncbi:MAG: hypothetical protein CMN77_06085 [Spirochaetaceae bacterium]|nr:hypothetical protein [Spirochaetaceae bacterium]